MLDQSNSCFITPKLPTPSLMTKQVLLSLPNAKNIVVVDTYEHLVSLAPDHILSSAGRIVSSQIFSYLRPYSLITATGRLHGGTLSEDDRALASKRLNIKICRKCYARLPIRAEHCRKRMCGYSNKLRMKKKLRESSKK